MKMHSSRLVFCHVPKTAGSSITRLLRDTWPGPHALDFFEDAYGHTDLAGALRDSAMLAGHLSHVNVLRSMEEAGLEAYKLTSLRNPLDLVLSNYYHLRAHESMDPQSNEELLALRTAAQQMSVLEWMGGQARHMRGFETLFDNPQIRLILNKKAGPITLADAQQAIAVMGQFDGVILFERLRESVFAVMKMLGRDGACRLPRLMTNPLKEQSVLTLARTELQALMALTRFDAVLYDVVSTNWCARMAAMQGPLIPAPEAPEAPEVLLADVIRTSNAQQIEAAQMGDTILIQGNDLFLHPPHGREGGLRIGSADFPAEGQGRFSTELSLEHPAAPPVELSLTIREGARVVAGLTTRVSTATRVPVELRFAPIMGRCYVDLEVRTLDPEGVNDYAWMLMSKPTISV